MMFTGVTVPLMVGRGEEDSEGGAAWRVRAQPSKVTPESEKVSLTDDGSGDRHFKG